MTAPRPPRIAERHAPPAAGDPTAAAPARAAWALWVTACVLAGLRALLAFVPTMHLWSLNLQRFLDPLTAWLPWTLAVLALVPALARRVAPALARLGDAIAEGRVLVTLACIAGGAALAWVLPDRVRFVGDFLLRQGTVEVGEKPGVIFPQALPLDVLLHYRLPVAITAQGLADANGGARMLGALEAALFAALALAFARVLGRRGMGAAVTAALVFFGGALGMFTGYSKAFSELMLLVVVVAVSGIAALRGPGTAPREPDARGPLFLGLAVAVGVVLHRTALAFVPAMLLVWWLTLRRAGPGAWRRPAWLAAIAIPLAAIAIMTPRIVADVLKWDVVHFNPAEVRAAGGPLRALVVDGRPLDLVNLLLLLAPFAIVAPTLAWLLRRDLPRRTELLFLVVLALPMALGAFFVHPAQGLFRDWDDFAATGVAAALVTAWLAGETLRLAPARAWIGVTVTAAVLAASLQWLVIHADTARGFARVGAFISEPPERTPAERAKTWDYIGIVQFRREHWNEAAEAFAHAAETGPSDRILVEWAQAATNAGDLQGAADIYSRALARGGDLPFAWLGLAAVSSRLAEAAPPGPERDGRVAASRRAALMVLKLDPGNAIARQLLAYLERQYGAERDSATSEPPSSAR
jgi:hypothetical protein